MFLRLLYLLYSCEIDSSNYFCTLWLTRPLNQFHFERSELSHLGLAEDDRRYSNENRKHVKSDNRASY